MGRDGNRVRGTVARTQEKEALIKQQGELEKQLKDVRQRLEKMRRGKR